MRIKVEVRAVVSDFCEEKGDESFLQLHRKTISAHLPASHTSTHEAPKLSPSSYSSLTMSLRTFSTRHVEVDGEESEVSLHMQKSFECSILL